MIEHSDITVAVITQKNRYDFLIKLMTSIEVANKEYSQNISLMLIGKEIENLVQRIQCKFKDLNIVYATSNGRVPNGRQLAIQKSKAHWVLFVDDDCEIDKEIFREYSNMILLNKNKEIGAIYGITKFSGDNSVFFKACWHTPFVHPFQIASLYDDVEWAPTSNALFSKKAVKSIGGFDLSIPVKVSGEDVDIGIRLKKAGFSCLASPNASVYHTTATWNRFDMNIKRFLTYGKSEAWLAAKYPDRRKISWGTLIVIFSILLIALGTYFFGSLVFLIIPFIFLCWILSKLITWILYSIRIPLLSYIISDIYLLSNYIGYVYKSFTLGIKCWGNIFFRFIFYGCKYIQKRIKEEGPY